MVGRAAKSTEAFLNRLGRGLCPIERSGRFCFLGLKLERRRTDDEGEKLRWLTSTIWITSPSVCWKVIKPFLKFLGLLVLLVVEFICVFSKSL